MHNQPREPQHSEDCQAKSIQEFGVNFTRNKLRLGQGIKSHHTQTADQLFKDADLIFQQDLAPAHTAKSTKSWFNDHGVYLCLIGQQTRLTWAP